MARDNSGQLEPGTVLAGRYRIERFLAGGGMGQVYVACDLRLADRRCAIKEIFERFNNPEERARAIEYFHREADTLSHLKHPSVPAVFDRFGEGNCHYLVMDYVEGTTLEDELAAHGGILPESRVIEIARELCDVLSYLHGFQPPIIYRDMKPGNVILTPTGRAVLIDFGIARIFSPQGKATLIGTPCFAPPEQYSGQVDERSDLYGLAATLHYLLTGRDPEKFPPFSFPPVHELKPDASPFLAQAIDKALAYKSEERPQSVLAFKEMFLYGDGLELRRGPLLGTKTATRLLSPLDAPFTTSLGEPTPSAPPPRATYWKPISATFLFVAIVLWGGYQLTAHPQWFDVNEWMRWGERIPWQKVEAWLPERGKVWLREFVADLPWEREKRLQALRDDSMELISLKVFNSSRDGTPASEQKSVYRESEVKYLTWEATLKNRLVGMEGHSYRLEGQFLDPEGGVAGKSEGGRFVGADEAEVSLRGVTLLEGLKERAKGDYQLDLYAGGKKLGTHSIRIEAEPKKVAATVTPRENTSTTGEESKPELAPPEATNSLSPSVALAALEEKKRLAAEQKRLAQLQVARQTPLTLMTVRFLNTDKDGKRLQAQTTDSFELSQVRFISWEAVFRNNLFNLESSSHRLEGTYRGPQGEIIGTVRDYKEISPQMKQVTFTARLGNSSGNAFKPGLYHVEFYLDGYPLLSREFAVKDDRGPTVANFPPTVTPATPAVASSQILTGTILDTASKNEVALEIDLQQQGDGRVSGKLTIRESRSRTGLLEGRVHGRQIEFHSAIGSEIYHFEGWRDGDRLTGTYRSLSSIERGRWSVRASDRPSS